jgi:hypothetical protein
VGNGEGNTRWGRPMSDEAMQEAVQTVIFLLALVMTVATMIGTAL